MDACCSCGSLVHLQILWNSRAFSSTMAVGQSVTPPSVISSSSLLGGGLVMRWSVPTLFSAEASHSPNALEFSLMSLLIAYLFSSSACAAMPSITSVLTWFRSISLVCHSLRCSLAVSDADALVCGMPS
eukprot:9052752-Pyramimonas_sp.AAC.2